MPFPTTRHSTTDVDTTGNKRPSIETCYFSEKKSPCNRVGVLAAIQSTTGSDRTSMEACPACCDTQPVFCNAIRACRGCRFMLRPMEKTKSHITEIMRHKLSRYVYINYLAYVWNS